MKSCWMALVAGALMFAGCGNDAASSAGAGGDGGTGGIAGSAGLGGEGGAGGMIGDACSEECANAEYCAGETCDGPGACAERPTACTRELDPVCGCDGKDYGNPCEAASAGARVDFQGQCSAP